MNSPIDYASRSPSPAAEFDKTVDQSYDMLTAYMKSHPDSAQEMLFLHWKTVMNGRQQVPTEGDSILSLRDTLGAYRYYREAKNLYEGIVAIISRLNESKQEIDGESVPDALEIEKRRKVLNDYAKFAQASERPTPEDVDDEEVPSVENLNTLNEILEDESCGYCDQAGHPAVAFSRMATDMMDGFDEIF
ncbi:hypothetical protein FA95DRAFT_1599154 [Auriscalpium vulgare]|uniref:Uncharacterized protein n=1 Tax=Auriscalpium vulgare TaxID=40419 RepID=A0ACB8RA20_9AGAM|nr:hypothetical protein FA95DRAFT_1599154 [Auriscalpium vulgare]